MINEISRPQTIGEAAAMDRRNVDYTRLVNMHVYGDGEGIVQTQELPIVEQHTSHGVSRGITRLGGPDCQICNNPTRDEAERNEAIDAIIAEAKKRFRFQIPDFGQKRKFLG